MKNKIFFRFLVLMFLGFGITFGLKAQTSPFVKGLSGLPITNSNNDLEVRFFMDYSVKIDYPSCYAKADTIIYGTDSTSWGNFFQIKLQSYMGSNLDGGASSIRTNHLPFSKQLVPEFNGPRTAWSSNETQLLPVGRETSEYPSNGQASVTMSDNNYMKLKLATNPIEGDFVNDNALLLAGDYIYRQAPGGVASCGDVKVESRLYNVIAQFRKKPTVQNPNPSLDPYYCNGGGPVPTLDGGYRVSGRIEGNGGRASGTGGQSIKDLCRCAPPDDKWLDVPGFPPPCKNVPLNVNGTTPVLFVDHPAGEASEILKATITPGSKSNAPKEVDFGISDGPTRSYEDWQLEDNKPHVWKLEYEPNAGTATFTIYKCGDSVKVSSNNIVTRLSPNELEIKTSVQWENGWPDSYVGMKLDLKVLSINKKEIVGSNAFSSCTAKKGKHIWNKVTVVSNELMRDKVVVVGTFNIDLPGVNPPANQGNIRFQVETNYDPTMEGLAFPLSSTK